jgi:hypothetical protein
MGRRVSTYAWGIEHGVVPAVARPFLRDLLDEVRSDTHWHHQARRVEFLFYSEGLRELFNCRGEFILDAYGGSTRMRFAGDLDVTPMNCPAYQSCWRGPLCRRWSGWCVTASAHHWKPSPAPCRSSCKQTRRSGFSRECLCNKN